MQDQTTQSSTPKIRRPLFLVSGILAVVVGLIGSSFGSKWSPQVYEFLGGFKIINFIDTFAPYFPGVPFYPIFIIMMGAFLIVKSKG